MPKVTVIIPTFNRARFARRAVESVLNQSFTDREVIIVDDGSTDHTRSVLEPFRGEIRYIYQRNSGPGAARNTGIVEARGEWLAFLDSDDEWSPEYLSTQMEGIRHGKAEICIQATDCCIVGLDGSELNYFKLNGAVSEFKGEEYLYFEKPFPFILSHGPWQVGSTIFSKRVIKRAGMFDTSLRISEDLDFMARMSLFGGLGLIRKCLVSIYRRRESIECLTEQAKSHPIQARESDERMYKKLNAIQSLKQADRTVLKKMMSANRRAMGNLHLKNGKISDARSCYKKALLIDYSLRSLGRYVLSYF